MPLTPSHPQLSYAIMGDPSAPLVVLVGGLGSVQAAFVLQVRGLMDRHQVLTYDHRGCGGSESWASAASMKDYAGDLVRLLDHLAVEQAHFVGISFGGRVLQELALGWPERVQSLILCGTSTGGPGSMAPAPEAMQALIDLNALGTGDPDQVDPQELAERVGPALFGSIYLARYPNRVVHLIRWRMRHPVDANAIFRQRNALKGFDASGRVGSIQAPVLVVNGTDDGLCPVENARRLAASIPGAQLTVMEGIGHSPNVEAAERFNEIIASFVAVN